MFFKVSKWARIGLLFLVIGMNAGCDQISKTMIRSRVGANEIINVIEDNFILTKVENTGAAMSLGSTLPEVPKVILLQALPVVLLALLLIWVIKRRNLPNLLVLGICFYIGGGIGNLWDRILYGSVTDFLYLEYGPLRTGIFNLADVSVMMGTIFLLIHLVLSRKQPTHPEIAS